jgi:hypothetical protein
MVSLEKGWFNLVVLLKEYFAPVGGLIVLLKEINLCSFRRIDNCIYMG